MTNRILRIAPAALLLAMAAPTFAQPEGPAPELPRFQDEAPRQMQPDAPERAERPRRDREGPNRRFAEGDRPGGPQAPRAEEGPRQRGPSADRDRGRDGAERPEQLRERRGQDGPQRFRRGGDDAQGPRARGEFQRDDRRRSADGRSAGPDRERLRRFARQHPQFARRLMERRMQQHGRGFNPGPGERFAPRRDAQRPGMQRDFAPHRGQMRPHAGPAPRADRFSPDMRRERQPMLRDQGPQQRRSPAPRFDPRQDRPGRGESREGRRPI